MLGRRQPRSGVRVFDPHRDFGAVAELISRAFGDRIDPAGQASLDEMRRVARWGPLVWWFWPEWSGIGSTPGFVWVEDGRVVGNVSLRRALGWGGFLIGNVAVHPDWQGRGIGKRLIEAALEDIANRGGHWVGLEVQADNESAHRLYAGMHFREVGRLLHVLRPAGLSQEVRLLPHSGMRRGRSGDGAALVALASAGIPEPQRPLLELRKEDYQPGWERALDHWLEGRREVWWVIEENAAIRGAVRARHERRRRPDRLEVLISPGRDGEFEDVLVRRGLTSLGDVSRKMVEALLPRPTESLVAAFQAVGFRVLRELIQMRRDLA